MIRLDNRLLLFALGLALLFLALGCSQSDNITASKKVTNLWLTAERLPNPPVGMVYELWVASVPVTGMSIPANELVSLGKFSFVSNDSVVAFLDVDGEVRADSNQFKLQADAYDFEAMFISVEPFNDSLPETPGPIMLIQSISGQTDTLRLAFPLTAGDEGLNGATCRYNLEGITMADRGANGGYGLWFSSYRYEPRVITDTVSGYKYFDTTVINPVLDSITGDTLNRSELYASNLRDLSYTLDTVRVTYGRDSLLFPFDAPFDPLMLVYGDYAVMHQRLVFHYDSLADSTPPFLRITPRMDYDTGTDLRNHTIFLDIFQQDDFGLPVYDDWGWKYQGWVVSTGIPAAAVGRFTPPAWRYKDGLGNNRFPGDTGGLLTTGTFSRIAEPDDANPFTLKIIDFIDSTANPYDTTYKVPLMPGEDFLDAAALSAATHGEITSAFNLLPPMGRAGTVFISLEPTNKVIDSTNSALIAFAYQLPSTWRPQESTTADRTMFNYTAVAQETMGFPRVIVRMIRL
jgi:hypothetical protein